MSRVFVAAPLVLLAIAGAVAASGGEPAPLMPADLKREADHASPAVADILRKLAAPSDGYDVQVLAAVDALLKLGDGKEGAWAAEKALRAGLRYCLRRQQGDVERLADRLMDVRRALLKVLEKDGDGTVALTWAEAWLPLHPPDSPLAGDIRGLWVRKAEQRFEAGDLKQARVWLDRIDATFWASPQADPLRKKLLDRAVTLVDEAKAAPDAKAAPLLNQALALWPRLPGAHDELAKRTKNLQVLYVAVGSLPEYFSPALAWTDGERQAVALLFESLVEACQDAKLGARYRPMLVERLPGGTGVRRRFALRRDVFWSDGERFVAADVRHTAKLLGQPGLPGDAAWPELLDIPQLEDNPFSVEFTYRQGLLDPWSPLTAKMLPQQVRGKPLSRADDVEFAKQPIGTGPFYLHGREAADGRTYVVFKANPHYLRGDASIREIRFFASSDPESGKPPHLVLDVRPNQIAALKKQGYAELRHLPAAQVWFLAVNHRRSALANVHLRRALAQAIDRHGLLDRHFRGELKGVGPAALGSIFPAGTWAACPPPRVPEKLHSPEDARASARKAKGAAKLEWTLKYPQGDAALDAAFADLAEQVRKTLAGADVQVLIRPVPLPPRELQKAVRERDFDLIYHHLERPDSVASLWPLFDPDPEALKEGGSNYLGCDDGPLQGLLRSALHHRQFSTVRTFMHDIDAHLHTTMPVIPLWQLPYTVALHDKLRAPEIDGLAVFANVLEWKVTP